MAQQENRIQGTSRRGKQSLTANPGGWKELRAKLYERGRSRKHWVREMRWYDTVRGGRTLWKHTGDKRTQIIAQNGINISKYYNYLQDFIKLWEETRLEREAGTQMLVGKLLFQAIKKEPTRPDTQVGNFQLGSQPEPFGWILGTG